MITEITISSQDIELIKAELEANKPYEACGVLIGILNRQTAQVEKALPVANVKRTRTSFELDPEQFYDAWNDAGKKGREIVGIYHTHPVSSAVPSLWDRETMEQFQTVWLIAGADGLRAYIWDKGIKQVKLVYL